MSTRVTDDTENFIVNVISEESNFEIFDVVYNEDVGINEEVSITYKVKNLTEDVLNCYGAIVNKETGKPIIGSYWYNVMPANSIYETDYLFEGTDKDLELQIRVGLA